MDQFSQSIFFPNLIIKLSKVYGSTPTVAIAFHTLKKKKLRNKNIFNYIKGGNVFGIVFYIENSVFYL
jgi:hypothetical protein